MNESHDPNRTMDNRSAPALSVPQADCSTFEHGAASVSTGGSHAIAGAPTNDFPEVPGYRVLREIAHGGMGRVLGAFDLVLERDVALKVLLPGAHAERFVRESRITARLQHPGIPPVYALGELADGSPFLAMKFVAGQTLSVEIKSSDKPRLLQVFTQVCQAVGFAHSRGVIHRDLKPANIMVGAFGEVHVMDWGLAKEATGTELPGDSRSGQALAQPLLDPDPDQTTDHRGAAESTGEQTKVGEVLGTPTYMAPEQARGETLDARADVFALGGILCAILTGRAPFGGKSSQEMLQRAAAADLAETHARLDGCSADAEVVALCRRCLSPSPADRPRDGQTVADELISYLDGVQERLRAAEVARAAEAARAKEAALTAAEANERVKAERRARRVQVIAAGLLLLVLAGGVVGTTLGLLRANQARERAVLAETETKKRASELQKVSDFQSQMLRQVDPASAGLRLTEDVKSKVDAALVKAGVSAGEKTKQVEAFTSQWSRVNATDAALDLIDRTILKPAVAAIDQQFPDQPLVDAALRHTLGERYEDLGLTSAARPLLERALETRQRLLGEEHPDTLMSMAEMGRLLTAQGKHDEALAYYGRVLEIRRRVLGEADSLTIDALRDLGSLLVDMGKKDDASPLLRQALDQIRQSKGEDDPVTLSALTDMGKLLKAQGKLDDSLTCYREVFEKRRRVLGADHPDTIGSLNNLGAVLTAQGKPSDAAECFRDVLQRRRRLLGEVHPETLHAMNDLSDALAHLGKEGEAEALMREALAIKRRLLGVDHPSTLVSLSNLAVFLIQHDKAAEAEPLCKESLEKNRRVWGADHPNTLVATNVMGYVLLRQNKPAAAEPFVRTAIDISRRINGDEHLDTLTYIHNLAVLLRNQKKLADAESNYRVVMDRGAHGLGQAHPIPISARLNLAGLLNEQERFAEAAELLSTAEPIVRKTAVGVSQRSLALLLTNLGKARAGLKQFETAEHNLLEAHPLWVKVSGPTHKDTLNCIQAIADLYTSRNAVHPGKGYDAKAKQWKTMLPHETGRPSTKK